MDLTVYSPDEEFGCYIASNESRETFRHTSMVFQYVWYRILKSVLW